METITIKYDDTVKTVAFDDFVRTSRRMLSDFGLEADEKEIEKQIHNILSGEKLNVIGVMLEEYIVKY